MTLRWGKAGLRGHVYVCICGQPTNERACHCLQVRHMRASCPCEFVAGALGLTATLPQIVHKNTLQYRVFVDYCCVESYPPPPEVERHGGGGSGAEHNNHPGPLFAKGLTGRLERRACFWGGGGARWRMQAGSKA